ncbi:lipopolysaccharide biosynthesis protein [uncultured Draconibacterium sp.]|uniref:lipopolysaccharide biosynthesis protein n=1 Tax=uncultured Draconibacterium sp. TaxID=1573823 RepID=UPI0025FD0659|nr:polysaccharide biosynthesis C-terminal domain-containing protein [uncultured Draconibacterium sp.]
MLQDIKKTTRHSSVYAIGNISIKVIGLILLPLYTNEAFLSKDDFGMLAILEATAQVLTVLLAFALSSSLIRWYWDEDYKEKQKSIVFTIFSFLLVINTPVCGALLINADHFSKLIFGSISFGYLLQLTFITVFFRVLNSITLQLLQIQSRSVFYTVINVVKLLVVLLLTVFAITKMGRGLNGIWEASVIGEILMLLLTLPYILKNVRYSFEWKVFKEMFVFGYPLVLSNLAVITLTVTDRYMLNFISGLAAAGIYSLGLRLANTLKIVITDSVMAALAPIRLKKFNDPNNHRFFSKILTYTSFLFILVMLVVSLFSLEAIKLITKTTDYWRAAGIIGVLSFAFLFSLIRINLTTGLMITKKSNVLGVLTVLTAVLNFGLNILFIPLWDIYGAAAATLISQFIYMCVTYYAAQNQYKIPYEVNKLVIAILVAGTITFVGILIKDIQILWRLSLKIILLGSFPFILLLFNFYEKVEIESIKNIFASWRNPKMLKENLKRFLK